MRTFARRLSLPQRFYLALFEVLADFDHLLVILDRQCLRPNNNELHVSKSMEPLTSMIFCFSMMATITARILSSVAVVFSRYSWYACSLERKKKILVRSGFGTHICTHILATIPSSSARLSFICMRAALSKLKEGYPC